VLEFATALGRCRIAWSGRGVARLRLPQTAAGRAAPARQEERAPPEVAPAIAALRRYFEGEPVDFSGIMVDLTGVSAFHARAYEALRAVGWGRTVTYGELARRLGAPHASRAIGQAMARNPVPVVIPCHRVLAAGDRVGGFSAPGGRLTKARLLALEGIAVGGALLPF
jgi:methylated-DNA-[protein]-cysteine S-methyltransferase